MRCSNLVVERDAAQGTRYLFYSNGEDGQLGTGDDLALMAQQRPDDTWYVSARMSSVRSAKWKHLVPWAKR